MEKKKKINFKQPKYIFPLIILPFALFIGYLLMDFMGEEVKKEEVKQEIATSLGSVDDPILGKNEAYEKLFSSEGTDNRTMIQELDKETDSLFSYTDVMDEKQKRYLDSLSYERSRLSDNNSTYSGDRKYYNPKETQYETPTSQLQQGDSEKPKTEEDLNYERSLEIIKLLNNNSNNGEEKKREENTSERENFDPVESMRKQMLFLDSLEKAKDPEYRARAEAERKRSERMEKLKAFANKTQYVSKTRARGKFNHISKEEDTDLIKAVIDEDIKGYLGSRIRIRLLEDVYIGKKKVKKGTFLYAEITGFTLQRVNLNIVSAMIDNKIYPINLSIYDMDGLKGLYVPASAFREMMRELGSNSVQGVNLEGGQQGFFSSLATNLFQSASTTIAAIIRKNKVKLKYNSYLYLINEQELKNETDEK